MHNHNNFQAQNKSVAGPKKISPHDFKLNNREKKVACKDFLRLRASKWSSSQNTGH
jgi:hypothetical protein